ncbi:MAG: radical SAM protein [Candidatus Zixiibacteriota bacterium]
MTRLSPYNHFFPYREDYYLAFNAYTGAVAMMTAENYATYQLLVDKLAANGAASFTAQESELLEQLRHGRFVYDDVDDQFAWLKFRYRRARQETSSLGLVIAPTMACNMACQYCFEGNKSGRMSSRVVESLIGFIERQAPKLKDLQISWYGGEPLLALDIIDDITQSVFDLAREHKFAYAASMISNGYLLSPETVDRLVSLRVSQVQVTLDGPSEIHDRKRPLKNGKVSFETIIRNLQYAVEKMTISVRVNIDQSFTPEMIRGMTDELTAAGLRDRVGVYFGMIEPATAACANISEHCFETRSYSQTELTLSHELLNQGFRIEKLPGPIMNFCFAQLTNSFLIDPDGDMYRCFNYAGDKSKSMGNIARDIDYRHAEFLRLFSFDPFEEKSCRDCSILPVCMGGCPARRSDRALPAEEYCDSWKFNLAPMLEVIARSRQQQMARQGTPTPATKESV